MEVSVKLLQPPSAAENSYNCYQLRCNHSVALIDAPYYSQNLVKQWKDDNLTLTHIFLTHCHIDSIAAALLWKQEFKDLKIYAHKSDSVVLKNNVNVIPFAGIFKAEELFQNPDSDYLSELEFEGVNLKIFHTPGHTPGSVCIQLDNKLFTGDTIYAGVRGCATFPESDLQSLKSSFKLILQQIPGKFDIYPAHGNIAEGRQVIINSLQSDFRNLI